MKFIGILLAAAVALSSMSAKADGIVENAFEAGTKYLILKGTKKVVQTGVRRLAPKLASVAKKCFEQHAGGMIKEALTDSVMAAIIDSYLDELGERSRIVVPESRRQQIIKDFFDKEGIVRSKAETELARKAYNADGVIEALRSGWSEKSGILWPRGRNIITPDGVVPGSPAQAHHINPLKHGGSPSDVGNIWPLFGREHQPGIHKGRGSDNLLRTIFACFDKRSR